MLFSLPVDLLVEHILSRLSLMTLIACLSVSRKEGMIDNPCCSYETYPRSKRLDMLRERAMRWKDLDSKRSNFDSCTITPAAQMLALPTLRAYVARLPVTVADTTVKWDRITLGKHILSDAVAVKPSEKLVQIHLVCRSTRKPHPLASLPVLDICAEGRIKANMKRSFHGGVLFLRDDLLLVPNVGYHASLDILYILRPLIVQSLLLPQLARRAHIQYLSSITTSTPISSPSVFPPHTDPLRPFVNDPLSEVLVFTLGVSFRRLVQKRFICDKRLILLNQALALLQVFLSQVKASISGQGGEHGLLFPSSKSTPWESWGPQATWWLPYELSRNSMDIIATSSGTRCLLDRVEFDFQTHFEVARLRVLNFGLPALLQSPSGNIEGSSLTSKAFTKPVISYLPCAVTKLPWKMGERNDVDQDAPLDLNAARLDWSAVCMDDERILCNLKDKSGFEVLYFG
ncbi:hypothetical protein BDZ97DRAFT_1803923 [Flammula alnicola]|nr:hypothetical protein BDZ97DRAFT_1803923 [Flammula alnicola]